MLSSDLISHIMKVAELCAPREMCGLIFPHTGFIHCRNTSHIPEHEFNLDHEEYQAACKWFGATPWALVHSHPGTGAAPSPKDCQLMDALQIAKQDLAMVIVGLEPVEIRCFKKVGELYQLQWLHVPAKALLTMNDVRTIRDALSKPHPPGAEGDPVSSRIDWGDTGPS